MKNDLPPPWQSGYAIPDSVNDEGLERHAYVTAMPTRGTFDDPNIAANTGYATPAYVKDEAYGQGARTTQWAPRGTYNGPRIPNWLNRTAPTPPTPAPSLPAAVGDLADSIPGGYATIAAGAALAYYFLVYKKR